MKDCLKDGNFDIAKEKMSILKDNVDRNDEPNFHYSDEDRGNSFEINNKELE